MSKNSEVLSIAKAFGYPDKKTVTRQDVAKFFNIADDTAYRNLKKWGVPTYNRWYYMTWDVAKAIYSTKSVN